MHTAAPVLRLLCLLCTCSAQHALLAGVLMYSKRCFITNCCLSTTTQVLTGRLPAVAVDQDGEAVLPAALYVLRHTVLLSAQHCHDCYSNQHKQQEQQPHLLASLQQKPSRQSSDSRAEQTEVGDTAK
jgi:hypothetical protein